MENIMTMVINMHVFADCGALPWHVAAGRTEPSDHLGGGNA